MSDISRTVESPRALLEGQRLDQSAFHDLYESMPPGTRAELIDGVVYMPSPIGMQHGGALVPVIVWLAYFAEHTPGVQVMDNVTTIVGRRSELQPDAMLRILPECGGRTSNKRGFVRGAPELVFEVARASRYVDLGPKLVVYQQAGVLDYIVHAMNPDEILWFSREQKTLVPQTIGSDGLYRSTTFPGLWLDPQALVAMNYQRLRAVLDLGCATPEHAAFVAKLAAIRMAE
jgi:hypothetical protein